ncbi:hypothetical protein S101189_01165 [Pediococcus acidilactici]|uniref:Abi-alpha family protein n=1 Tax=Pediococcus acidilactici TaxID=1254 RepID=UPI0007EFCC2D|nr:Abi-alpha family protein [Pediococcus acidilactici]ARW24601.1 hypothetical protein S100424_01165 [Pediococcus acidilactici]ARW26643.1 hypothetical protein S100313_01208 [Pediococcus acidilactici]ARW28719.1 hypothetical protein S101189_01165 [Pediococcus acidilactici]KAF0344967.1 DUF4393 domain-containing protein [Pediococcus acidilactici]OBR30916.1 hypothetical protein SRCM100320_00409 [Pediococcus acidilactici]
MDPNLIKSGFDALPESTVESILNPTGKILGDSAGGLARTICYPLLMWNIYTKEKLDNYANNIHKKINSIPEKRRDVSRLPVFLETLEKSKYKIGEDDIREMFENLLSKSLDSKYNDSITPRDATVIAQLGYKDASALNLLSKLRTSYFDSDLRIHQIPVAKLTESNKDNTATHNVTGPIILTTDKCYKDLDLHLDNLRGLGIIEINFQHWLTDKVFTNLYNSFKNTDVYHSYTSQTLDDKVIITIDRNFEVNKGFIHITDFGTHLMDIIK